MKKTILSALLLPSISFAVTCTGINSKSITSYDFINEAIPNCDYVKDMSDEISRIQSFSEKAIPINLTILQKDNNASFDGGTILQVPMQFVFTTTYGQEYSSTISSVYSVIDHEYGHALLENKLETELSKDFPDETGFIQANKKLSTLKLNAYRQKTDANLKLVEEAQKDILANQDFIRFARVTTAYSELYADVVSVYNENDKNAMLKALYYDEMNNFEFQMIQARSFDTEYTSAHQKFMTEEHGYFAYTRNFIGKKLWPKNDKQKKLFLKLIGDAIVSEVRSLLEAKSDFPEYDEANKKLIEKLQSLINQNK